jgi:hypothetical protein
VIVDDLIARIESAFGGKGVKLVGDLRHLGTAIESEDADDAVHYARKSLAGLLAMLCEVKGRRCEGTSLDALLATVEAERLLPPKAVPPCRELATTGPEEYTEAGPEWCVGILGRVAKTLVEAVVPRYRVVPGGDGLTEDRLLETLALDREAYPEAFQFDAERLLGWYRKNPGNYILIVEQSSQRVVGYINAMSLTDEYYARMGQGDLIDVDIPTAAIRRYEFPNRFHKLYFCDFVVSARYRNTQRAPYLLLEAFFAALLQLAEEGHYIREAMADALGDFGRPLAEKLGMTVQGATGHETTICRAEFFPPGVPGHVITMKGFRELWRRYKRAFMRLKRQIDAPTRGSTTAPDDVFLDAEMVEVLRRAPYDVFISYRRDRAHEIAGLLEQGLEEQYVSVFLDRVSIGRGRWDRPIEAALANSNNVVVVLFPDTLERCREDGDWVRREIAEAIGHGKNLVMLCVDGFDPRPSFRSLPPDIKALQHYKWLSASREHLEVAVADIAREIVPEWLRADRDA